MLWVLGVSCAVIGSCAQESGKPEALVALERARSQLRTGRIVWKTQCNLPERDDGLRHRWHTYDKPQFFASQFTPNEYAVDALGDEKWGCEA